MTTSVLSSTTRAAPPRRPPSPNGVGYIPLVAFGVDLMMIAVSVLVAVWGQDALPFDGSMATDVRWTLDLAGPVITLCWVAAIFLMGGYRARFFGAGIDEYKRVINASLVTAAVVGIGCYLLRFELSRGFFVLTFLIAVPILLLGRYLLRRSVHSARSNGALQQRVVIAGTERHVEEIAAVLEREKWLGYDVVGALTPQVDEHAATLSGIPLLGSSDSLAQVALDVGADTVFLAGGAFSSSAEMRRLAWDLEHEEIAVVIAPSVTDVSSERISVRPVGGLPLIHLEKPRSAQAVRRAKRTFDFVGSLALLLLFSPVFAFCAVKIWRFDGGPILFHQTRVGRNRAYFHCLKFRTMVTDAEDRLAQIHAERGSHQGIFVKVKQDPRVTRPGHWLRRLSLDELPQLVNVLRGDMSLVGPRPQVAHEVALYDDAMARRLHVRPGMTGLWQVSGRSDLSMEEAIRLDLYYVDNWSMLQDLTILARTLGAVVAPQGAY